MTDVQSSSQDEINDFLATDSNWRFEDDRLKASFTLDSFEAAIDKINEIAKVCSEMNHHPLMTNVYNKLMFSITTHGAGNKVTKLDIELAKKISEIIAE